MSPRTSRLTRVLPAAAAALVLGATSAAAVPSAPGPLPKAVDAPATYVAQSKCDPVAKPGVVKFRDLLLSTYRDTGSLGIVRACNLGGTSEHKEGRAFDWAVNVKNPSQKAEADAVVSWLTATDASGNTAAAARRLGVMYIVWNHRIWGVYNQNAGWRAYGGSNPHTDHVHFSFSWAGAAATTSFWTTCVDVDAQRGRIASGQESQYCATPKLKLGSSGESVKVLQRALGISQTGNFGPLTQSSLRARQSAAGLPATGITDIATWAALGVTNPLVVPGGPAATWPKLTPEELFKTTLRLGSSGAAVADLQRRLGLAQDGTFGTGTQTAVKAVQSGAGLAATGVVDVDTWLAVGVPPTPRMVLSRYAGQELKPGDSGPAVTALQTFLGQTPTAWYGPVLEASIRRLQDARDLPVTGALDAATWRALLK